MDKAGLSSLDADERSRMEAVRELRARLDLSLMGLGRRINRAVNTVVRYESQCAPKGEALLPYAALALDSGFDDLVSLFRAALINDLGADCERVLRWRNEAAVNIAVPADVRPVLDAFLKFMSSEDLLPAEELLREGLVALLLENFGLVAGKSGTPSRKLDGDDTQERIKAARELRARLNESQTVFGKRIGRTINTVLRYESHSSAKGEALVPYAAAALDCKFFDLAEFFRSALIRDLGPECERVLAWRPGSEGTISVSRDVRPVVKAFLKFMCAGDLSLSEDLARKGLESLLLRNFSRVGMESRKQV